MSSWEGFISLSIAPKKGVLLKVYHKKTIILSNPLLTSDLIHNGIYLFAMPTKVKIKDREKSDWLTKSLSSSKYCGS